MIKVKFEHLDTLCFFIVRFKIDNSRLKVCFVRASEF